MSGSGGARAGAGRKAGKHGVKLNLSVKLSPIVLEFLQTVESRGEFIDGKVMSSAEFRRWRKESAK